jgi:hypothetical protein
LTRRQSQPAQRAYNFRFASIYEKYTIVPPEGVWESLGATGMAARPDRNATGRRGHPLTDHLVEGRSCGTCIGCCSIYQIPTLKKPKYVLCTYCTGTSCTIYNDRPQECRTFYCLWRRIAAMPEETRPDKIGIVFTYEIYDPPPNPFQKRYIIGRAIGDPAVFDTPYGRAAVNMFIREGSLPVFIAHKDETKMVYPDAAFSDAILNPSTTRHVALVPAALAWRKQYGMM